MDSRVMPDSSRNRIYRPSTRRLEVLGHARLPILNLAAPTLNYAALQKGHITGTMQLPLSSIRIQRSGHDHVLFTCLVGCSAPFRSRQNLISNLASGSNRSSCTLNDLSGA